MMFGFHVSGSGSVTGVTLLASMSRGFGAQGFRLRDSIGGSAEHKQRLRVRGSIGGSGTRTGDSGSANGAHTYRGEGRGSCAVRSLMQEVLAGGSGFGVR